MADGFVAGPSTDLASTTKLVENLPGGGGAGGTGATGGPDAGRLGGGDPR